jgi:hypothetical protein
VFKAVPRVFDCTAFRRKTEMNKNMQAILACVEGLRNLDNWPDSEVKKCLIRERDSMSSSRLKSIDTARIKRLIAYADPWGREISLFEWSVCCESIERNLSQDFFECNGNEICISTIWMGLNHSWTHTLLIFETMIFGIEDDEYLKDFQQRYGTLEEAEEGHKRSVSLVLEYLEKKSSVNDP